MTSQDDVTFKTQQFQNEVGARRDRIAAQQIDLNMQAGQLSGQAIDSWREGYRFEREKMMDANQLTLDQLRIGQAQAELAWAQGIKNSKAMTNALRRDEAATRLAVAEATKREQQLMGFDADRMLDPMYRAGAIASGFMYERNPQSGEMEIRESTQAEKDRYGPIYDRYFTERYGSRSNGYSPLLEASRINGLLRTGNFDDKTRQQLEGRLNSLLGGSAQQGGPSQDSAPQPQSQVPQDPAKSVVSQVLGDSTLAPIARRAFESERWTSSPFWGRFTEDERDKAIMSSGIAKLVAGEMSKGRRNFDPNTLHDTIMQGAESSPVIMGYLLKEIGDTKSEIRMKLNVLFKDRGEAVNWTMDHLDDK